MNTHQNPDKSIVDIYYANSKIEFGHWCDGVHDQNFIPFSLSLSGVSPYTIQWINGQPFLNVVVG